jgi:pimeloyl-ACP methyl ester carboxylesterase
LLVNWRARCVPNASVNAPNYLGTPHTKAYYPGNSLGHLEAIVKLALALILFAAIPAAGFAQDTNAKPAKADAKAAAHTGSNITMEEMFVPSKDPGIKIYVRNKRATGMSHFTPEKTVLFVHGATYPAETSFDLELDGLSWMDYIAERGYDVYLMDVRGYGRSTRPPEMDAPPDQNAPIADTETAVRDISAVVDHILARRKLQKMELIGWSWGTSTMATYTAGNNDKVVRLVLYAPIWHRETASLTQPNGPIGAYRTVLREAAFKRWMTGVPEEKRADLIPAGWFDKWWDATLASDPKGPKQNPPALRAPNGTVLDGERFWSAGKSTYDPAKITVPILLIQAEWDQDTPPYMSRALFPLLVNSPEKRYVQIGEGTHTVMMEKNRMELFNEVQMFLDEGATKR